MFSSRIQRPSPALVISIVALVFAVVGTGYAAIRLPRNSVGNGQLRRNSVGARQIRRNAVNGAKVRNRSLTGRDINLRRLGTVPSAGNAVHATSADTVATEPTHFIGTPGQPPFLNGTTNAPGEGSAQFPRAGFF